MEIYDLRSVQDCGGGTIDCPTDLQVDFNGTSMQWTLIVCSIGYQPSRAMTRNDLVTFQFMQVEITLKGTDLLYDRA